MLLSLGLITRTQLDDALAAQRASRLPIGKQLVALGSVSEIRLTQVLSNQLSVPWVSLERCEFPAELLARIPAEIADHCSVLPIYVRNLKGKGATLYVAMDDPTDDEALKRVSDNARMLVRPMIAPPSEIRRVIDLRYFGTSHGAPEETTGLRSLPGRGAKQFNPNADIVADKAKPAKPKKPPPPPGPTSATARPEGVVSTEQYETPSTPPAAAQRTLTLLDGTQIKLPTASTHREAPEVRMVRHLVKAIRTAKNESGAEDPVRWHDIAQAILDSLETRGVRLTRKEVADAWLRTKAKREQPKAQ